MSISERQEKILEILNTRNFVTVNELAQITFTSPSSIRRDLSAMQNVGLVKRSHGGVTLPDPIRGVASFYDRTHQNIQAKRLIAKKAVALLHDGQSILMDSSSTAGFLLPHIAKLNYATLFTNNIHTALSAIELGIDTHCLGGHSVNGSSALAGTENMSFYSAAYTYYNVLLQISSAGLPYAIAAIAATAPIIARIQRIQVFCFSSSSIVRCLSFMAWTIFVVISS